MLLAAGQRILLWRHLWNINTFSRGKWSLIINESTTTITSVRLLGLKKSILDCSFKKNIIKEKKTHIILDCSVPLNCSVKKNILLLYIDSSVKKTQDYNRLFC